VTCPGLLSAPYHVGIATTDVDGVMAALGAVLGQTWVALERPPIWHHTPEGPVRPSPRVEYSAGGPLHIELLESATGTIYSPAAGTHLHHLGYWTDDFAGDLAAALAAGWSLEASMNDEDGMPSTFCYLTRPARMRVELVDSARRPEFEALMKKGRQVR
jgi:hypothetical protein